MSLGQEIPQHPWSKLAIDLFHFEGASYFLIVDYTSQFPVVHSLSSMTGQHVGNQCKLIFSEYSLPEALMSDNGPCYTAEAFTSVMNAYHVNHIISHYPQSNELSEKYVHIVKSLFYKAKEEGKDLFKCLTIYCNTPLSGTSQSLMQILQSRSARSDVPMSNAARQQLGLQPEKLRNVNKNEHLPSHDGHIGQDVVYQDATSKQWYPATIPAYVCSQEVTIFTRRDGVTYRKTQAHLKPYQPQSKKSEDEHSSVQSSDMQTLKVNHKQFDSMNNQVQSYYRPKRDIKPPVELNF